MASGTPDMTDRPIVTPMPSVPLDISRRQILFGGAMVATSVAATVLTPRARETALPAGGL